jgi:hypothetical protein
MRRGSPPKNTHRLLPWKARANAVEPALSVSLDSEIATKRILNAHPYVRVGNLPASFRRMRATFEKNGIVDCDAARRARCWVQSRRKKQYEATLNYDKVWAELCLVANHAKCTSTNADEAWCRYTKFALSMSTVMEPLLCENSDGLTMHDYGYPLSLAGVGCVEAAFKGETPYANDAKQCRSNDTSTSSRWLHGGREETQPRQNDSDIGRG